MLRVHVNRNLSIHRSPGGYILRTGSSKRKMSQDQLGRLFQQRSQIRLIRFDQTVVPNTTLSDLEPNLLSRFRTEMTVDSDRMLAKKLGLAADDDWSEIRLTVAGVLMATARPEQWLRNAVSQAVAYRGDGIAGWTDEVNYQVDAQGPGSAGLQFRGTKPASFSAQDAWADGSSPIRHDLDFRSRRECCGPSGLFDAGIEGPDANDHEPVGIVVSRRSGQLHDPRYARLSTGHKKRNDSQSAREVQRTSIDSGLAVHPHGANGSTRRRCTVDSGSQRERRWPDALLQDNRPSGAASHNLRCWLDPPGLMSS